MSPNIHTQIIYGYHFPAKTDAVVTIGNFDGFHIGHQALIHRTHILAQKYACPSIVITFEPHPAHVLGRWTPRIQTPSQKIQSILKSGVNFVWVLPFTRAFGRMAPYEFIERFLSNPFHVRAIVVGYDFRFGKNQLGDVQLLQRYSMMNQIECYIVDKVSHENIAVHSSLLRDLIRKGKVNALYPYLGRFYSIKGTVVRGQGIGKKLLVPTANILWKNDLIPKPGVYITRTLFHKYVKNSISNIGYKPTFSHNMLTFETHIFDFDDDIIGEEIEIEFVKRIRDEKKFHSIQELKKQILYDIEQARQYFSKHTT